MQNGRVVRQRLMMARSMSGRYPAGRVAVIVSKKVYKSAVKRNRIRRRIYNIVRHELARHQGGGFDIVITVFSPEALAADSRNLQREVSLLTAAAIRRDQRPRTML